MFKAVPGVKALPSQLKEALLPFKSNKKLRVSIPCSGIGCAARALLELYGEDNVDIMHVFDTDAELLGCISNKGLISGTMS